LCGTAELEKALHRESLRTKRKLFGFFLKRGFSFSLLFSFSLFFFFFSAEAE